MSDIGWRHSANGCTQIICKQLTVLYVCVHCDLVIVPAFSEIGRICRKKVLICLQITNKSYG